MSPEVLAACSAIGVAAIGAGPAYLASRRTRGAAQRAEAAGRAEGTATREATQAEGTATREALELLAARLDGRLTEMSAGIRADMHGVRDWQTSHTAEHVLIHHSRRNNPPE